SIPLPPLAEQERIAGRLTEQLAAVERARGAAQSRLAAAESLPAAYLREVFGPVAPFSAAPLMPKEGTRPGWRWHLLTDIARLATGHTPSRREPTWWGGDIQWLQLPDIRAVDGRRVTKTIEQTNPLGIANSSSVLLPAGTVCMSRTASVGFVTIMGREMATSQDFVNWVCGPDLDPDFLMYLILRCRREIRDLGSGATHQSIYFETVENFSVCVPSVA
ncbi:MAG: restriction endonuclease subunit S, partial [bacterium]